MLYLLLEDIAQGILTQYCSFVISPKSRWKKAAIVFFPVKVAAWPLSLRKDALIETACGYYLRAQTQQVQMRMKTMNVANRIWNPVL